MYYVLECALYTLLELLECLLAFLLELARLSERALHTTCIPEVLALLKSLHSWHRAASVLILFGHLRMSSVMLLLRLAYCLFLCFSYYLALFFYGNIVVRTCNTTP